MDAHRKNSSVSEPGWRRWGCELSFQVRESPGRTGRKLQPRNPEREDTMPFTLLSDEELIARLLIHTWTLTTGRTIRSDIPPYELTEEELIDFWAYEHFD